MREVIEERPEHDRAGVGLAAPARPRPGRSEVALLTVAVLTLAHQLDHVLRADASGWPFTRDLTWFTVSLLLYPALLAASSCSAGGHGPEWPWPRCCWGPCRRRICSGRPGPTSTPPGRMV